MSKACLALSALALFVLASRPHAAAPQVTVHNGPPSGALGSDNISTSTNDCFGLCSAVPPPCTPNQFEAQWGGTRRAAHHRKVNNVHRLWTGEDGGRIRFSTDNGISWIEQETPRQVREKVQGIFFLPDGSFGWAVTHDGYVLATHDGGTCWKVLTNLGDELWDVFFMTRTIGWVCGNGGILMRTGDGGCTWTAEDVDLPPDLLPGDVEYYSLDFMRRGDTYMGLTAAEPGLILRRTNESAWSVVLRMDTQDPSKNIPSTLTLPNCCLAGCTEPVEIWDIEIAPDPYPVDLSFSGAVIYAVAGIGNSCGMVFRGVRGGLIWSRELHQCAVTAPCWPVLTECTNTTGCKDVLGYSFFSSLYGVFAIDKHNAVAVGYGAQVVKRNPLTGYWEDHTDRCTQGTQPLYAVVGDRNPQTPWLWSFGVYDAVRHSKDAGVTWREFSGKDFWRLRELVFTDAQRGWAAGQHFRIVHTEDGGETWCVQTQSNCEGSATNFQAIAAASASNLVAVGGVDEATNKPGMKYTLIGGGRCHDVSDGWLAPQSITCLSGDCDILSGVVLHDVAFSGNNGTANEFWAVGTEGVVLRSYDNGVNWVQIPVVVDGTLRTDDFKGITFLALNRGFVVGADGAAGVAYAFVISGGVPFFTDATPLGGVPPLNEVSMRGLNSAWAVGDAQSATQSTVLRWDNLGGRFVHDLAAELLAGGHSLVTVAHATTPQAAPDVWVGGDGGTLLWSMGGVGWCAADSETDGILRGLSFVNANLGWASGYADGGTVIMKYKP